MPGPFARGLGLVQLAASSHHENELAEEYQDLFIGLGRGEIVPFASWYLTGSLMELPLAVLRADLQSLGFERQSGVCEPEDHLAALCEVMAVLIGEQHPERNRFYERHLAPWVLACCRDQQQAKGAASTGRSAPLPKISSSWKTNCACRLAPAWCRAERPCLCTTRAVHNKSCA